MSEFKLIFKIIKKEMKRHKFKFFEEEEKPAIEAFSIVLSTFNIILKKLTKI